jgi:peroxiredoxin
MEAFVMDVASAHHARTTFAGSLGALPEACAYGFSYRSWRFS